MQRLRLFVAFLGLLLSGMAYGQTPINMTPANNNQTFNTCNGFLIDSGGQGGPGYSNNESTVITICPSTPGEIISIVFNLFNLDPTNTGTNQNPNIDFMAVYDGTSTAANSLGVYTGTQLQGVVIEATLLNPTGCITLEFYSNTVGTGQFTASISCETPCANPQAGGVIVNGITPDSIRVCVGDTVSFQEQGSFAQQGFNLVNYMWDFMDGDTANGTFVEHVYDTPGFYKVQLFVTDNNGCGNPNLIDLQVLVGTIPDFTGFPADTGICLGESMTFVADPLSYQVEWNGFPGSQQIDDGCLPDTLLGVSQDIELLQTGFSAGTTIQNVNDIQSICLDLEHSFMGDLVILIECPTGQTSILHQQGGGGTQIGIPNPLDNVDCSDPTTMGTPFTYCFTPNATETWVDWVNNNGFGQTLPAGNYASVQPLSNLVGCPTNGIWTLTVIDNWAADDGTLFGFSLDLNPAYYPPAQSFEPIIGLGSDSSFWFNPQFQTYLDPDADSLIVTPTQSGSFTYNYFVIDNFGCEFDTSVVLTVDPLAPTFAGNDTSLCDNSLLTLNGEIVGLVASCDYVLTMEDSFGDTWNGNTMTITINGVSTDYTCSNNSIQIENLTIPAGANVTVTFNANGGWTNECSFEIVDGSGNVVMSMPNGQNAPWTNSFTANCVPQYEYAWSPAGLVSDPTISDPTFTGTGAQQLVLTTFPVGHPLCATTDTVNIFVSVGPYPGEDTTISICPTAAAFDLFPLLGPGASTQGSWIDDLGNPFAMPYDPNVSPAGNYTYVTDSLGCTDTAVVTINHTPTTLDNATPTDVSCNGAADGEIVITATNMVEYTINGGAPIAATSPFTITGLAAGTYTVAIFSAAGCADSMDIIINEPAALQLVANPIDANCVGTCDGSVQINVSGGVGPYTYTWPAGVNGNQNGAAIDLCAGTFTTDVTDANGCIESVTFNIIFISDAPYPGADSTIDICVSAPAFDLFPLLGAGASTSGTWQDPLGNPVVMPYDPSNMAPGAYVYTTDSLGCTDQATITVNHLTTTVDNVTPTDALCFGNPDGTITIDATNMVEYTVNQGAPIASGSPFTITGLATGTYTVAVFSADGCADSVDVVINEPTVLQSSAVTTDASCFGDCDGTVQVAPTGGTAPYNYTWLPGTNGNQNGLGIDLCAGQYITAIADANGCLDTVTYVINEPLPLEPALLGDQLDGCYPHMVNFTNTTAGTVTTTEIDFGDGTVQTYQGTASFNHQYANPGSYTVTITVMNGNNCLYTSTYNNYVTVYDHPNANFQINPNNISMLEPVTALINTSSQDVVSWFWEIPNGTPTTSTNENVNPITFPYDQPGDYPIELTVTNAAGCTDSIIYYVTIDSDVLIFAPNTFTPDNDEFNQNWMVHMSGIDVYDFELVIYNRWGEVVWESRDVSVGWDGTYGGRPVQDGTYTWFIKCADLTNDEKYEFQGHLNVIR